MLLLSGRRWCGRRDSNPHGQSHQNLNLACLPVPPRPHSGNPAFLLNGPDEVAPYTIDRLTANRTLEPFIRRDRRPHACLQDPSVRHQRHGGAIAKDRERSDRREPGIQHDEDCLEDQLVAVASGRPNCCAGLSASGARSIGPRAFTSARTKSACSRSSRSISPKGLDQLIEAAKSTSAPFAHDSWLDADRPLSRLMHSQADVLAHDAPARNAKARR